MTSAARMVNVVTAVTPDGDPDPQLFDTLEQGLTSLAEKRSDPAFTALIFQIRLLGMTGFRPQTDHCAACGETRLVGEPQFSALAGGLVCPTCAVQQKTRCIVLYVAACCFCSRRQAAPILVTRLRPRPSAGRNRESH